MIRKSRLFKLHQKTAHTFLSLMLPRRQRRCDKCHIPVSKFEQMTRHQDLRFLIVQSYRINGKFIVTITDDYHRNLPGEFCHLSAETRIAGVNNPQRLHFPHHPQIILFDLQIPLGVADKHAVSVFLCHGFDALQQHDIIGIRQRWTEHDQKFSALCRPADPLLGQMIIQPFRRLRHLTDRLFGKRYVIFFI